MLGPLVVGPTVGPLWGAEAAGADILRGSGREGTETAALLLGCMIPPPAVGPGLVLARFWFVFAGCWLVLARCYITRLGSVWFVVVFLIRFG